MEMKDESKTKQDQSVFLAVKVKSSDPSWVRSQLTRFSDTKDFTQDECELDAASGKGTLMLVFPAAVLQDKLGK